MNVEAEVIFSPNDQGLRVTSTVLDPFGAPATPTATCLGANAPTMSKHRVEYHGNGTYILWVRYYAAVDVTCATPTSEERFPFAENASTSVTAPAAPVLLRQPNRVRMSPQAFAVALNPGGVTYEVRYAHGGVLASDGSISGPSQEAFVDRAEATAQFSFRRPGKYTIVARMRSGDYASPWSAPAAVTVVAPFDLDSVTFPDARGPTYTVAANVREPTATGVVSAALVQGEEGGRFVALGRARLKGARPHAVFTFTRKRLGIYRLKFTFPGSATIAAGTVVQTVRITRTLGLG